MMGSPIINDDYAVLEAGGLLYYYGYEYGSDADGDSIWGFYVAIDERPRPRLFQLTHAEMRAQPGCPDQFECGECLLFGIGLYLERKA